jgi:hypothetical protein
VIQTGFLSALLIVGCTFGTSGAEALVKVIDLTQKREQSPLFLVFCARDNTPSGHAFVVWGKEDAAKLMSTISAFGFYAKESGGSPSNGSSTASGALFETVPGEIADDLAKGSLHQDLTRFIVKVNKGDYDAADAVRVKWAQRTNYSLLTQDCVTFVGEVAAALALSVPERSGLDNFPWRFVRKLAENNDQSQRLDGFWQSTDEERRFRLEIRRRNCVFIERNKSGASLRKESSLSPEGSAFKIVRANDAEVLSFFYQPSLRSQILSRNPPASEFRLTRKDSQITGEWRGLIATKDNHANLKDVRLSDSKAFLFEKLDQ